MSNALYYGDNLAVLRESIATESVDLIYLDPPFNSNASYNVLFKAPSGEGSQAQIEAFEDTWHWNIHAEAPACVFRFDFRVYFGHGSTFTWSELTDAFEERLELLDAVTEHQTGLRQRVRECEDGREGEVQALFRIEDGVVQHGDIGVLEP